jgi:glycerophosphoryl diester phosphodiesterase
MSLAIGEQPVLIFGHRGASAHAPENTLAAFRLAVEQGADGIELDAKLSADGQIVVIHDPTVDRTTNGHGRVSAMTLAELQSLDAGSRFDPSFAGERIPTLEQVLEAVGGKCLVDIEITNYATPFDPLPLRIADLVRRMGLQESVLFTSFFPSNLFRVRRRLARVPTGQLAWSGWLGALGRGWLGRQFAPRWVLPYYTDLSAEYIQRQHALQRKVIAWTVNQSGDAARLLAWGVDGIITDDPLLMREVKRREEGGEGP